MFRLFTEFNLLKQDVANLKEELNSLRDGLTCDLMSDVRGKKITSEQALHKFLTIHKLTDWQFDGFEHYVKGTWNCETESYRMGDSQYGVALKKRR